MISYLLRDLGMRVIPLHSIIIPGWYVLHRVLLLENSKYLSRKEIIDRYDEHPNSGSNTIGTTSV